MHSIKLCTIVEKMGNPYELLRRTTYPIKNQGDQWKRAKYTASNQRKNQYSGSQENS